jgi:hypothetical protein
MKFLRVSIEMEAIIEHSNFFQFVGTGIVAEASSITNLFPNINHEDLIDPLGNSFHFRFSQKGPAASRQYSVQMWSNGPNGSNEMSMGDDISIVWTMDLPE